MDPIIQTILLAEAAVIATVLIISRPYLGIVLTLGSLPAVDLLPEVPGLTSILVLIGALTLVGFLLHRLPMPGGLTTRLSGVHLVGLLFAVWILASNFQAAWSGSERNWFLTFVQLWVLLWLTSELMDSPDKQRVFMWLFSIASAITALIAIQQGNIGDTISSSIRGAGLTGNPNSAGRYLVVAMIFFSYLYGTTQKRSLRVLAMLGVGVTFLGVFFTLSRTSILLLIVAIGLQTILSMRRNLSPSLVAAYLIAGLALLLVSDQISSILSTIMPSILQGTDTVGVRYKLWEAAWRMWLVNPIQGVGIGMFPTYVGSYAVNLNPHYWKDYPHNTYLSALAETGLVGFALFGVLIVSSLRDLAHSGNPDDRTTASLRNVWLTVFLVVLLGEVTSNGLYDKLLWFLFGVSLYFRNRPLVQSQSGIPSRISHSNSSYWLQKSG